MSNKELLEKVVKSRLEDSISKNMDPEDKKTAFKEAMEAMDRQIEMERALTATKEQKYNRYIRYAEVGIPVLLFTAGVFVDRKNIKDLCNFEKDYTFTTTAGRSWANKLFKSRK